MGCDSHVFAKALRKQYENHELQHGFNEYREPELRKDGVTNTLSTVPKDNYVCVAMRGRNPENPSDRTSGVHTEQCLEINQNGTSNTLTSVQKDNLVIGYSSFKLDYVVKWLNDYFEFYGEAKVSCDDNGWIPVQGRLPEDNHKGIYDMQLVTLEDGEVCMGVYNNREKEWWTRKQEGERWYTNKHNVIAWQPLPEPYKEEKKC